jgi:hypothetical protein
MRGVTDLASLPSGVHLRPGSSVFQLRIGVPKDLQQHFRNPKTGKPKADAFRASLRTSNRAEAGTRAHEIIAEWQRKFDALRAKDQPAPIVPFLDPQPRLRQGNWMPTLQMRTGSLLCAAALTLLASAACASDAKIFDGYDSYYTSLPNAIFHKATKEGFESSFYDEKDGLEVELDTTVGGRKMSIVIGDGVFELNGVRHAFKDAVTFQGESSSGTIPPTGFNVYISDKQRDAKPLICLEGVANGSGEYDRYKQVYLIVNPTAPKRAAVYHLASLFASCKALVRTGSNGIAFPANDYLTNATDKSRIGVISRYYKIADGVFVPTGEATRLLFEAPDSGNVFRFSVGTP